MHHSIIIDTMKHTKLSKIWSQLPNENLIKQSNQSNNNNNIQNINEIDFKSELNSNSIDPTISNDSDCVCVGV